MRTQPKHGGGLCTLAVLLLSLAAPAVGDPTAAPEAVSPPATQADWPQWCGPNRDSVVAHSPKLLDAWPKEGPPLAWKSEWIPGYYQGGCGGPAVAGGKVFIYATSKRPVGGGDGYKLISPEVLANAGWLADLPADLARQIEAARTSPSRPNCHGWPWWEIKEPKAKAKDLEDYLAKKPELDKYIKDFLATLKPEDARKYGDFIKRRLSITPRTNVEATWYERGVEWSDFAKLIKLQDVAHPTLREWAREVEKATGTDDGKPSAKSLQMLGNHFQMGKFLAAAWEHSFTRSDTLTCLDATTGKVLWKKDFPLDAAAQLQLNSESTYLILGLCGTPAVLDDRCYFGGATGLYCLSAKDGAVLWQAKCPPSHTSVLAANNVVYYCGTAYRAGTGQVLWKSPLWKGKQGWGGCNTNPALWKSGGKTYVLANDGANAGANVVCGLDLETGKDLWTLKYAASTYWPDYFASRGDGDILASEGKVYRMTPTALEPLTTLEDTKGGNFSYGAVMYQDHLYQVFGAPEGGTTKIHGLCCWDLKTGGYKWSCDVRSDNLKWDCKGPISVAAYFPFATLGDSTPSILADGKIIMALGKGYEDYVYGNYGIALIKATPEKFVPLGYFESGLIPWCPMAFAGGKLFVRTEIGISCYDLTAK